jgi:hypothetical protein
MSNSMRVLNSLIVDQPVAIRIKWLFDSRTSMRSLGSIVTRGGKYMLAKSHRNEYVSYVTRFMFGT